MRLSLLIGLCVLLAPTFGGCPTDATETDSSVSAVIGISSTRGEPPLKVVATGVDSSSRFGDIVRYRWNFGGLASFEGVQATYEFVAPGLYEVSLTVTDATGREATAITSVRVSGGEATAVIASDATRGTAPLAIRFDASGSTSEGDTIRDYYWDFGDGGTSRAVSPTHLFERNGEFTVTLRVVTGSGAESTAAATIVVGTREGSLQFDGSQTALLPFSATPSTLNAFTFEAWIRADAAGGAVFTLGAPEIALTVLPASSSLRISRAGAGTDIPATSLSGAWRHVALACDGTTAVLYLDGVPLPSAALAGGISAADLRLGSGFRGKIAQVRLWNVARSAAEIAANRSVVISGGATGLIGAWPLDEGQGQNLSNLVNAGLPGILGLTTDPEAADPAWSTDHP